MNRSFAITLIVICSTLGFGQVKDTLSDRPNQSASVISLNQEQPLLIEIVGNKWYDYYPGLYSINELVPLIAAKVKRVVPNVVFAESTTKIIAENEDRLKLEGLEFVDKTSPIFQRGSIRPAEWILECTFGGDGDTKQANYGGQLGTVGIGISTEGGTSTATAHFKLIKRVGYLTVATISVKDVYSSTNITNLDANRFSFLGRGQAMSFNQSSNGGHRRGIISTSRCLQKLDQYFEQLFGAAR